MNIIEMAEELKALYINYENNPTTWQRVEELHVSITGLVETCSLEEANAVKAVLTDDVWFDISIELKRILMRRILTLGDRTFHNLVLYSVALSMDHYDENEMKELTVEIKQKVPSCVEVDFGKYADD